MWFYVYCVDNRFHLKLCIINKIAKSFKVQNYPFIAVFVSLAKTTETKFCFSFCYRVRFSFSKIIREFSYRKQPLTDLKGCPPWAAK